MLAAVMNRRLAAFGVLLGSTGALHASPGLPGDHYDRDLCATAQRMTVNAPDLPVRIQRGVGNGFHTIQMSADPAAGAAVVAMTTVSVDVDGEPLPAYVACKMLDRARVNDELGLALPAPSRTCRDVNEHTWQVAWQSLTDAERRRYRDRGRALSFGADQVLDGGGVWLPANAADYVETDDRGFVIRAPSVRVPWHGQQREFFQGIRHCKLITLAAARAWLRESAYRVDGRPIPSLAGDCKAPAQAERESGSCLFYFAPMNTMYCEDYNGEGWSPDSARAACGRRHASREALQAVDNRYEGSGGVFSSLACRDRDDAPAITGSCVFNCGTRNETTWQVTGPANAMLDKACDLYLPAMSRDAR